MDADPDVDNLERLYNVLIGHFPAGTSTLNLDHWAQMVRTREFKAYDYGAKGN